MGEATVLAVDLGTSSLKTALITLDGRVIGWESEPLSLILTPDGGTEQSPEGWWRAFVSAARRLLSRAVPSSVQAICCSTQGEGTIPVDASGRALANAILWMDMRGAASVHRQFGGVVNVSGMGLARLVRSIRLTGGIPSPTGKDPAGHMLFIRDNQPELYERTHKFLNVLDYLNLRLTGRFVATVDSILTSWVTDNRRPERIVYHPGLVAGSGIDGEKLPEIVACTERIGTLLPEAAAELGLRREVRVVAGAIDTTAAAIGSGAVADYAAHLYIGTSSWIAAHVPFKKTDVVASLASVPCALPHRYLLTALQATAGGNLSFLRDNILYHKDELLQEAELPDVFKIMDEIVARVPPGSNGLLYTPWIWGERAPVDERTLRAGLYNVSLNTNREDIIRAFFEGVAYNTRWLLEPVSRFLGRSIDSVSCVGGGAVSRVWCRILADVLGIEVRQMREPIRANARGAAFIAAVGLGELSFDEVPGLVRVEESFTPDRRTASAYDRGYRAFREIYRRMHRLYAALNAGGPA